MSPPSLSGTTDRRMDALLSLLADNPMIVISGQKIAKEMGVARSSVWVWTQKLRALGVRVKGNPGAGYRIERVPDVLCPTLLRRQLRRSTFGKRVHHFFKAGSTNAIAFELGQAGEPHGSLVVAEEQTAGRGRAGRSWHSEKTSGVYMSLLLRPALSPMHAPLPHSADGTGAARRRSGRDRPGAGPALAQRSVAGRQEVRRYSDRDACRAGPRAFCRRGHRRERESQQPARRRSAGMATSLRMVTGGRRTRGCRWWCGCCASWRATTICF